MECEKGSQLHNTAIWDARPLPTTNSLIRAHSHLAFAFAFAFYLDSIVVNDVVHT